MSYFSIPINICVAPTKTLSPASNAYVDIYNVNGSIVFEFGIPRGSKGDT